MPSEKTKELLGLGNSLVLRCDDCVKYHLEACYKLNISKEEVVEALSISLLIGGTIVIPHLRRAFEYFLNCLIVSVALFSCTFNVLEQTVAQQLKFCNAEANVTLSHRKIS